MRPDRTHARDVSIGIIGDGIVGGALYSWFESINIEPSRYDPAKGYADRDAIASADVVFVCVPTPYTRGRGFDDSFVVDAIRCISGHKIVVLKSTVLPGTTELLQERFPQHHLLFNPEFLREATAVDDMLHPERQIVGYTAVSRHDAPLVLSILPPAPFVRVCIASEAEMAKYVVNSFLAVKVTFANEIYDLCARMRIDYAEVRDIVASDARIGGSHLDVLDGGYRGYGGKCLPKDTRALLDLAKSLRIEMRVLAAADEVNAELGAGVEIASCPERVNVLQPIAALERAA